MKSKTRWGLARRGRLTTMWLSCLGAMLTDPATTTTSAVTLEQTPAVMLRFAFCLRTCCNYHRMVPTNCSFSDAKGARRGLRLLWLVDLHFAFSQHDFCQPGKSLVRKKWSDQADETMGDYLCGQVLIDLQFSMKLLMKHSISICMDIQCLPFLCQRLCHMTPRIHHQRYFLFFF